MEHTHGHKGCSCQEHHEHHKACGCHEECNCHEHDEECGCHEECNCHEHHEECGCGCGHSHASNPREGKELLAGAGLFFVGLILGWLNIPLAGTLCHVAAYLLLGLPVWKAAAKGLRMGHMLDENFLMSIATVGAFAIREVPEAVGVMLFYRIGTFFEHTATARTRSQIMEAVDLRPETVTREDGTVIPAEQAEVGDMLILRPGDRVPLDAVVVTGESRLDTSAVTGESVPVAVGPGSHVISGCVNGTGLLTIRVERLLSESMVTRILESVEHAAARKPRMDRFLTRFARFYTPVVVAIAAATAILPSLATGDWNYWVYTAMSFLVMSCPCALVISVPLAFFAGIGTGSKQGILFKGGASIEALAQIKVAAMDKTGTLTHGDFTVLEISGGEDVLQISAACEQGSTHPIARSICAAAKNMMLPKAEQVQELAGLGICARIGGRQVLCGSRELLETNGVKAEPVLGTAVYVAVDGAYLGHLILGDTVKEEATGAVFQLKKLGVVPAMVTGDRETVAKSVARRVGIQAVHASLLPQEKLSCMETLRKTHGGVLFVGDGINDAPVLAGADVGGAMGSGADGALEAADVVYLTSRVDAIPQSISLARRVRTVAWQNVAVALGFKAVVMLLGLLGFANMWLAVFADSGVAMLCVLNSVRMLYSGKK